MSERSPVNVGVLGATGTVGQRFILLLSSHPFFRVSILGASSRSAGQLYHRVVKWKQTSPIPSSVRELVVKECKPKEFVGCSVIFSGLDADVAGDIELAFRAAEFAVFSNAKNHRRDPVVPLIVPLVNPSHLEIIPRQRSLHKPPLQKGFIITNANCSTTGLVVPLAALERAFGPLSAVLVTTMQAISGAGYPGVPSLDIIDNVVPYIGGEEEKMEYETLKILGGLTEDGKTFDMHASTPLRVSASCNRVPVVEGHTGAVSVRFAARPPPTPAQVEDAFRAFKPLADLDVQFIPSAPAQAIFVHEELDRPQPRLDRNFQDGASISVGRVRECPVFDIKFVFLINNVALGAATSSIMNAEIALARSVIQV